MPYTTGLVQISATSSVKGEKYSLPAVAWHTMRQLGTATVHHRSEKLHGFHSQYSALANSLHACAGDTVLALAEDCMHAFFCM